MTLMPSAPFDAQEGSDELPYEAPEHLIRLREQFGLSAFEQEILLMCAGYELDNRFAGAFAAAHGEPLRLSYAGHGARSVRGRGQLGGVAADRVIAILAPDQVRPGGFALAPADSDRGADSTLPKVHFLP